MKTVLVVTGILAALVVLFPGLVVIGMFLLVVPGLILGAMPTLFLYLLATWLIRMALPIASDWIAYPLALGGAVALASLATLPLRSTAISEFEALAEPEIVPDAQIAVSGHELIHDVQGNGGRFSPGCGALCLALLDLDAVEQVTVRHGEEARTFELVEAEADAPAGESPEQPERILQLAAQVPEGQPIHAAREALIAHWAERLTVRQRLVEVATPASPADWQLVDDFEGARHTIAIIGPDGVARLRKVGVTKLIPAIPPYLRPDAGSAASGFSGRGFRLAGKLRKQASQFGHAAPDQVFARAIRLKDYSALAPAEQP